MKVSELIAILEDRDPDLEVYVASSDHDYEYLKLHKEHITADYLTIDSDEVDDSIEQRVLCLGDGYV